jgi:hypothetical protein
VLLSAGAALEAQDQVSAVGVDKMGDESESEFSLFFRINRHLCTLLVHEAMWR